jgi:putative intracellular protease/amidase
MKIAFVIFNGITWLDLIGIYEPISKLRSLNYLPDLTWDICSFTETAADNFGLEMIPTKINESLEGYDAVIIPGGSGTRKLSVDNRFMNWIRTCESADWKI